MRRRGRDQGMLANPTLIGALTVLVTIVAVTLAYNANNGLPFVPRYTLHVQVADANELTRNAEVHMSGGALVGTVVSVQPARNAQGVPIAQLNLKLNKNLQPLPADSTFTIRLKGAIGLKYLEITRGTATSTLRDGTTVPVSHTSATVDLDQVLSMFDPPTRKAVQSTTVGYSNGFAGRGSDLNAAIGAFVPLFGDLRPVVQNLASSHTDLGGFFHGLENFTGALTPVAQDQASLFVNLNTTFAALARVARPFLQQWISETPPTFQAVIDQAPPIRPFLRDTAGLFADLQPGALTFPKSAPVLAQAFAAGTKNLPGTAQLNQRTVALARSLEAYGQNPVVQQGLDRLTFTLLSLRPPLSFLTPVQSSCNYITLSLRNFASLLSENVRTGTALRFNLVSSGDVLGGEAVPSQKPYLGPADSIKLVAPLHVNPYPNTDSPGQKAECAAGNEPYDPSHAVIGNPPGNLGLQTEATTRSTK